MNSAAKNPDIRPYLHSSTDRARVLLEINNAIVSHLDLKHVLKSVSDCLRREIKHDFAGLALYDSDKNELRLHALDFPKDQTFLGQGQLIPLTGTPASLAFATRKPVLRHRPDHDEFPADIMKLAYERGIRSGCAVPLLCHDKIVGSMVLASLRESAFTEDDAHLLTQIGAQVAIAVDNALTYERLRSAESDVARERDRKQLLLKINNAVVAHLDLREVVKSVSASLRRIIPHDGAFFTLLDSERNRLRVQALDLRILDGIPFEEGVSISPEGTPEGEAIAAGRAVLVTPVIDHTRFHNPWVRKAADNGVKSGCAVPLISHGRPLGALSVVSQKESAFTEEDAHLLEDCSGQIAIALENALNYENARTAEREAKQERDHSQLLLEVNNAVVSHLNLTELLKSVSARLQQLMFNDSAFIALCGPEGTLEMLAIDLGRLEDVAFTEGMRVPMEGTPEEHVINTGRGLLMRSVADIAKFPSPWVHYAIEHGVKSGCLNPLIAHGRTLGALGVVSLRENAFTPEAARLLGEISGQIAIAVENALNFEKSRKSEREATQERDRSRLLLEVNNAVVAHLSLRGLLKSISASLHRIIHHDAAFITLCNPDKTLLRVLAFDLTTPTRVDENAAFEAWLSLDSTPEGEAIKFCRPVLIRHQAEVARFSEFAKQQAEAAGVQSGCAVPLMVEGKPIGTLSVVSYRDDAFSQDDLKLLEQSSNQIAIAVQNALNFESAREAERQVARERDRSNLLLEISNALVSHLDLHELVKEISSGLQRVLHHEFVGLSLYDAESHKMYAQALQPATDSIVEGILFDAEGTISGLCIKLGRPVYVPRPDYETFPSPTTKHIFEVGLKTVYCVPVVVHGRTLGVLMLGSAKEDALSEDDKALFQEITKQVAIAAANAVAVRDLEDLKNKLAQEKLYLEDEIRNEFNFEEIIGQSAVLRQVLKLVETVAGSDSTVLLLGETGTGKELIARAVHEHSRRKSRTFVKLNCAAIPTGLLESELFGHEKGAFTGAIAQKIGRLELADQGTLFLDEVGDIPMEIQPKLLRALQEREFERLGSTHTKRVSVRLVAATNRNLEQMIEDRQFRSDLYYRLNIFPINIPPLRERQEDIPLLVRYFAEKFSRQMQKPIQSIPTETMSKLQKWHWPGNIRELENLIERAVILSSGTALQVPLPEVKASTVAVAATYAAPMSDDGDRQSIVRVLRETGGVLGGPNGAASRLGIKRTTLQYKIKKLGITRPEWWPTNPPS